jgi:magnesium/cobalt transport protein CorA
MPPSRLLGELPRALRLVTTSPCETTALTEETATYLRDCHDHTLVLIDTVETMREIAGGLLDVYLSSVNNRMNEVMKVLTIVTTLFIPPTFIASIYGMNFDTHASPYNMPELEAPYGYLFALSAMSLCGLTGLLLIWRYGWLRSSVPSGAALASDAEAAAPAEGDNRGTKTLPGRDAPPPSTPPRSA